MITTVLTEEEKKVSKQSKEKVGINTMTPNFNYKNKKGEVVKPNTEISL